MAKKQTAPSASRPRADRIGNDAAKSGAGLRVNRVSKQIDENWLLYPTNLIASPGQCVAVQGPNGAGKSTFLRIVAGQIDPTDGTATWNGKAVDERDDEFRRSVGCFIDPPATYSDLTLADHLSLMAGTWGIAGHKSATAVRTVMERFEIDHLARRFPFELSSGQGQLFFLSMAFLLPRDILILDEPEQRLDVHKREVLADMINAARAEGSLIIMASHSTDLVNSTAQSILQINKNDQ